MLQPHHIRELIPNLSKRIQFEHKFASWKTKTVENKIMPATNDPYEIIVYSSNTNEHENSEPALNYNTLSAPSNMKSITSAEVGPTFFTQSSMCISFFFLEYFRNSNPQFAFANSCSQL